jgi:hypothetical protein
VSISTRAPRVRLVLPPLKREVENTNLLRINLEVKRRLRYELDEGAGKVARRTPSRETIEDDAH